MKRKPIQEIFIPRWGGIKIFTRDVVITCHPKFVSHAREMAEKIWRRNWRRLTDDQIIAAEMRIINAFLRRLLPHITIQVVWDFQAGLFVGASQAKPDFAWTSPSVLKHFLKARKMTFYRDIEGERQFSWKDLERVQTAFVNTGTEHLGFYLAEAVLNKQWRMADMIARVIVNEGQRGWQPLDAVHLTIVGDVIVFNTVFGEQIKIASATLCKDRAQGRVLFKRFTGVGRRSIRNQLKHYL